MTHGILEKGRMQGLPVFHGAQDGAIPREPSEVAEDDLNIIQKMIEHVGLVFVNLAPLFPGEVLEGIKDRTETLPDRWLKLVVTIDDCVTDEPEIGDSCEYVSIRLHRSLMVKLVGFLFHL